ASNRRSLSVPAAAAPCPNARGRRWPWKVPSPTRGRMPIGGTSSWAPRRSRRRPSRAPLIRRWRRSGPGPSTRSRVQRARGGGRTAGSSARTARSPAPPGVATLPRASRGLARRAAPAGASGARESTGRPTTPARPQAGPNVGGSRAVECRSCPRWRAGWLGARVSPRR
ncbi:unnamed protein product, partial [Prorocentrum cordatum]